MNELKPCPVCGGKAEIKRECDYGDPPHWYAICTKCGISGCFIGLYIHGENDEECINECVKKWNRRADNYR